VLLRERTPCEQATEYREALQGPPFRCRDHRLVRALVPPVQALLPRPRRDNGRTRGSPSHRAPSCAGSSTTLQSSRNAGSASHVRSANRGAWMRRTSRFVAAGCSPVISRTHAPVTKLRTPATGANTCYRGRGAPSEILLSLAPPCGAASDLAGASRPRSARLSSVIVNRCEDTEPSENCDRLYGGTMAQLSRAVELHRRAHRVADEYDHALAIGPALAELEKELSDTTMVNDAPASLRLRSRLWVCVRTSRSLPKFRKDAPSLANALIGGSSTRRSPMFLTVRARSCSINFILRNIWARRWIRRASGCLQMHRVSRA
jgi:hypothetical protein